MCSLSYGAANNAPRSHAKSRTKAQCSQCARTSERADFRELACQKASLRLQRRPRNFQRCTAHSLRATCTQTYTTQQNGYTFSFGGATTEARDSNTPVHVQFNKPLDMESSQSRHIARQSRELKLFFFFNADRKRALQQKVNAESFHVLH